MNNELKHFGVPGMRWGHRNSSNASGTSGSKKSKYKIEDKKAFKSDLKEYKKLDKASDFRYDPYTQQQANKGSLTLKPKAQKQYDLGEKSKSWLDNKKQEKGKEYVEKLIKTTKRNKAIKGLSLTAATIVGAAALNTLLYAKLKD